ncbi:hypothetical protein BCR44DRAFT_1026539 [Catenaria anguillulae PL171]|uniref:Uncharacterized protein n=1 Tax=Catenaria anguillulae PL171 TaxID=765915 RepID=A0A1Y2HTC2_9FUNG|nr:hypothetical protein BCR44DRAFT_1026539 [Catenaria anguillulae PL171]
MPHVTESCWANPGHAAALDVPAPPDSRPLPHASVPCHPFRHSTQTRQLLQPQLPGSPRRQRLSPHLFQGCPTQRRVLGNEWPRKLELGHVLDGLRKVLAHLVMRREHGAPVAPHEVHGRDHHVERMDNGECEARSTPRSRADRRISSRALTVVMHTVVTCESGGEPAVPSGCVASNERNGRYKRGPCSSSWR